MNDYLSVIKLGYGEGQPGKQACWMTALQSHIGGEWTDKCACVDPTINQLCIFINDSYGSGKEADAERTADIMEFGLFDPLGTLGDEESIKKRMYYLLDVSLRRWLPLWLRLAKHDKEAARIEACEPIVGHETFMKAHAIAYAYAIAISNAIAIAISNAIAYANANAIAIAIAISNAIAIAIAISNAIAIAYANAIAISNAIANAISNAIANAYANAIANAIANAYANANAIANAYAKKEFVRTHVYPVLRELIDLGPCAPKEEVPEPVGGVKKFQELCGVH